MAKGKTTSAIIRRRGNELSAVMPAGMASWLHVGAQVEVEKDGHGFVVRPLYGSRRPKHRHAEVAEQKLSR